MYVLLLCMSVLYSQETTCRSDTEYMILLLKPEFSHNFFTFVLFFKRPRTRVELVIPIYRVFTTACSYKNKVQNGTVNEQILKRSQTGEY